MKNTIKLLLQLVLGIVLSCKSFSQTAKIEYIAHAAFILESKQGTRILIDPYHSYNQMGYTFPEGIAVDAVLITHAHYDHDGSKYLEINTPVFREAGSYQINDITFHGIAGKHAYYDRILMSGSPAAYNTMWVINLGDTQIVHLGDTATPTPEEMDQLTGADIIIGHPNDELLDLFPNTTYIPNHYLLPQVTKHTNWMQPIDGWLKDKEKVTRLGNNTFHLDQETPKGVLYFQPSSRVKEWPVNYYKTLELLKEARTSFNENKDLDVALQLMNKAIESSPHIFQGYLSKASVLASEQKYSEVIATLEKGFDKARGIDWGREGRAHLLLAQANVAISNPKQALYHYNWLVLNKRIANSKYVAEAKAFIEDYKK